jgi:hypothetical protein
VCTYTNVAVDNLVEGLVRAGLNPLRVGLSGTAASSALAPYTLDHKLTLHPLYEMSVALQEECTALGAKISKIEKQCYPLKNRLGAEGLPANLRRRLVNMETELVKLQRMFKTVKSRLYAAKQAMLRDVVDDADVVCCHISPETCAQMFFLDLHYMYHRG